MEMANSVPPMAIVAYNMQDHVAIVATHIPEDVVRMRLLREDLANTGDLASRVAVIAATSDNTFQVATSPGGRYVFYDRSALPGRGYRYFAVLQKQRGKEFIGESEELFVRIYPSAAIPFDVSLEDLSLAPYRGANGNSSPTKQVSFNIVSTPLDTKIDEVLGLMQQAGVSQIFILEVETNRARFRDLIMLNVERVNMQTGNRESFGLHPPGIFRDNRDTRSVNNVVDLEDNSRYTYFVKICVRPAQALLSSVFVGYSDAAQPGIESKKFLAQKFLSIYTNVFAGSPGGALPSDTELLEGIPPLDSFEAGYTGREVTIDASFPSTGPQPTNLKGHVTRPYYCDIDWDVSGEVTRHVDYAVVLVNVNGESSTLASVDVSDAGATAYYRDYSGIWNTPGTVTYTVRYMYRNGRPSVASRAFTVTNPSDLPSGFDDGVIEGDGATQ